MNFVLYEDKLKSFKEEGQQVNTHQIKKALRKVLRQTAEVFSDNETQSSLGSDKAPSEDNLDPEEIAAVVPIDEDPQVDKQKLKQKLEEREKEK